MFYDWLSIYQDFDSRLPIMGKRASINIDTTTGEQLAITQPSIQHEGSFSTSIQIRITGNRITISGNPSRINRIENLFGYSTLEQCVEVYNKILLDLGLPVFTKCTKVWIGQGKDGVKSITYCDGAVFTEVHLTTNRCVGEGAEDDYLRGLSTLPYRNSIPRLHTNAKTCDWLTKTGKGGSLIYPSVYNKAFELNLHALPKIKKHFDKDSLERRYLISVIDYCKLNGVVRFEQKIKSSFLRRESMNHYGLFDETRFKLIHEDFLNIDKKLQVESMNLESITTELLRKNVCKDVRAANTTTLYAINWMHGATFDFTKTQVCQHRTRLRKIGIDIKLACDISKFSLVKVRDSRLIEIKNLPMPDWYKKPQVNVLKLVA